MKFAMLFSTAASPSAMGTARTNSNAGLGHHVTFVMIIGCCLVPTCRVAAGRTCDVSLTAWQ